MKKLMVSFVIVIFLSVYQCAPLQEEVGKDPNLISYKSNIGDNTYSFEYETADGSKRKEIGAIVNGSLVVVGFYEFKTPDNKIHSVTYTADEKGYRAKVAQGPPKEEVEITSYIGSDAIMSLAGGGLG